MKKKTLLMILTVSILMLGSLCAVQAEIIPPHGVGQIGYQSVVLCESLSLRETPSDASTLVQTVPYGSLIIVMSQSDGWAECVLSDEIDAVHGWVKSDFIAIDPAWYKLEETTTVYAWNDLSAFKIGILDAGTSLPILKEEGDWILVSLRGATGWIQAG